MLAAGARDLSTGPDWGGYTVDEARGGGRKRGAGHDGAREGAKVAQRQNSGYREGWLPDD